jgi:hypothetical protein
MLTGVTIDGKPESLVCIEVTFVMTLLIINKLKCK